ncbi:MAG: DUF4375 domain-containing protein [Planctomycetales bacterium]|nr:DUF4375 domain-containing protein [Planctomycetales bacterium]
MTKIVIICVVVLAIAGIALLQFLRAERDSAQSEPGFREFVKDPQLWNEMLDANAGASQLASEAESWGEDQLAEEVERYVFSPKTKRDLWAIGRQLGEMSPKTNDALLNILRDQTNETRLAQLRPGDFLEEAPVMRVCELFDGNMPAEAIELLTPYLSHESDQIRKDCILSVAESGLPEALPAIRRALADEDEYVRSYALMGMKRAIENDKLSDEIRFGVVADLDRLVAQDLNVEDAARLMAQLDPKHAEDFLLSDSVLNTEKRYLHEVLRVVGQFDFEIRREKVKSLVETYAGREMTYPNTYALGESLALLGSFREPDDEQILERYSKHEEDRVSDGAARGLISFHNLKGFEERIWEKEQAGGWESLTKEQQMYVAVFWLDSEVNNGGHSQYFFNSAGDNWQTALDGLKAMGFKERLGIFQGVLDLFGDKKPLTDRGKRQDQLSVVYSKHEEAFDQFDSAYYKASESVEVFSTRFVIQNAD